MWRIHKNHEAAMDKDGLTAANRFLPVIIESMDLEEGDEGLLVRGFRLYDDDGNIYYEGLSDDFATFEPLDDYGTPNAGCTEIRYYNDKTKEWETL